MKQRTIRCLLAAGVFVLAAVRVRAGEEEDLLGLLRSDAAVPAKAEACKRLRAIGTVQSVPVLGELLTRDERLGQAARYALEALPGPEATDALRAALGRSTGNLRIGLIDSLGWRRDAAAVPLLVPALKDPDRGIATAAAAALGRVGGEMALAALQAARNDGAPEVARTAKEALLEIADRLVTAGDRRGAAAIYASLLTPGEPDHLRQAACAGSIRTAGDGALGLVVKALQGDDTAAQAAALRVAGELSGPGTTAALAGLLSPARTDLVVPLLALLRARGDVEAAPAVGPWATHTDPAIRTAALVALGTLGDASNVPVLLNSAAAADPAEQAAAREALLVLRRGDVTAALVARIGAVPPAQEREAFKAISGRAEASAVPALLKLARSERAGTRGLAMQALGITAGPGDLAALVDLAKTARSAEIRGEIQGVFETLVERMGDGASFPLEPLVRGMSEGAPESRRALFPIAALFADARVRAAFQSALSGGDEGLRRAAYEALATTRDPALLPDLLGAARRAPDPRLRSAAIEGCVRLATDEASKLGTEDRARALLSALEVSTLPADRRAVIAGLGQVPHRLALEAVEAAQADEGLRAEAEQAMYRIAQGLAGAQFPLAQGALLRLGVHAASPVVRSNAVALLHRLDSGWWYSGPYRQEGKTAEALFDVVFPPERPGFEGAWLRAPGSLDPARAGEVDLGGVTGGDQCVLYVRTQVFVPSAREVAFAIGSDDGIKLWVNDELVHANNAVRGLTPGQDRARGRLREGWNALLAKITQSTAGCGMTLTITGADGSPIPGLRIDATRGLPKVEMPGK